MEQDKDDEKSVVPLCFYKGAGSVSAFLSDGF